ncbi:MAG: aspartate aminotransferase family protein [Endomicrobiales bacterium]|jgi:predicted acetylornithine/succinylornithine family transaminase
MDIKKADTTYIMQTYRRNNVVFVRGKGQYLWDSTGKKYLDFFAGISVCNAGHCNPSVVAAAQKQLSTLMHTSNLYYTEPPVNVARELIARSFPGKVFFSNSGAEANECAIKLARKWGEPLGKYEIITFKNSFHGRTIATLSATGQKKFHEHFKPLLAGFKHAEFNSISSVLKSITQKTAAILIEPIQGEGGITVADGAFLKELRKICDKKKILLMFDEVQTGMGRTGTLFAWQSFGVRPDVFTLAKSVAGGLPFGATVVARAYADTFVYGDHGSTFGGNLVSCAAALAMLKFLTPDMLKQARATGAYLFKQLGELKKRYSCIKEVRGRGLMVGIELDFAGRDVVQFCQDNGLIINCTQDRVLRFLPPLVISINDVHTLIDTLEGALIWEQSKK